MSFLSRTLFPRTRLTHELFGRYFFETPAFGEKVAASTTSGRVVGFTAPDGDGDVVADEPPRVFTFRGIPYAVAGRNAHPRPVESWSEQDRECLLFGPACPQPPFAFQRITSEGMMAAMVEAAFPPLPPDRSYSHGTFSERDCLNLNVFTPSLDVSEKKKVLVWIHGGAFQCGSNAEAGWYDGARLARDADACVVTVNYRLHALGFLHFPDEGITNLGIRDQIAALEWVRDNVSNFGGDPSNVTILGESAGGMSVATLLGCPKARGLFHGAICMSGAATHASPPRLYGRQFDVLERSVFSKELGGGPLTAENFSKIPVEAIQSRMAKIGVVPPLLKELGTNCMLWQPYAGDDIIPSARGPHEGILNDDGTADGVGGVPVMTGFLRDEWRLFTRLIPGMGGPTDRSKANKFVEPILRAYFETTTADEAEVGASAERWGDVADELYDAVESSRALRGLPTDVRSVAEAVGSLLFFEAPSYALARDAPGGGGGGGYSYCMGLDDEPFGSAHARDVPLLFRGGRRDLLPSMDRQFWGDDWTTTDHDGASSGGGGGAPAASAHPMRELSDVVLEAFGGFAERGRPAAGAGAAVDGPGRCGEWGAFPSVVDLRSAADGGCVVRSIEDLPEVAALRDVTVRVLGEFDDVDADTLSAAKMPR